MKKRILIPYATYGNGHKSVALYIKKYFESNGDYECKTVDLISYSFPLFGFLTKKTATFTMEKLPFLWSLLYFVFDNKITSYITGNFSLKMLDNKRLRKEIEEFCPDITIATHFFGSDLIEYYNKKSITDSKLVVVVTDYIAHELWLKASKSTNAIIVGSIEERIHLLKKGFKNKQIHTTGIPIIQEKENLDKDKLIKKFKLNKNKKTVLFFVGGGNGSLFNLLYFKEMLKNDYDCNILFIAGKNKLALKKANEYVERYNKKNVKTFGFVTNVNEFYYVSDIVVTKPGGAQVTECLYFIKPMLLIKSNGGQEVGNRKYLCRREYAKNATNPISFNKNLKLMLNDDKLLTNMKNKISKIKQDQSMEKLFKIVEKLK